MKFNFVSHCLIMLIILIMSAIFLIKTFNITPLYGKSIKSWDSYLPTNFIKNKDYFSIHYKDKIILKNGISVNGTILFNKEKYIVVFSAFGMIKLLESHIHKIESYKK